jgi:hypothetical protein
MRWPLLRFTLRWMTTAIASTAIVLGFTVVALRWYLYPHINFTVFNESSTPIYGLRVSFLVGERTAEELKPGRIATSEIQSGGDAGIFFSYQDSTGVIKKAEPIYYESGDRGFVEVHITNKTERLINGIYAFDAPPFWRIQVAPTGKMVVR